MAELADAPGLESGVRSGETAETANSSARRDEAPPGTSKVVCTDAHRPTDAGLREVVDCWPTLPEAMRAAIVALVIASRPA